MPTIFGVANVASVGINDYSLFAPTWDNGNLNGTWIRSFLKDADEDGVHDDVDNLPPSMCPEDPFLCANPAQTDADGDGVGDERDNCPPSLCIARGLPVSACANPALVDASGKRYQLDSDGDGTGDVCDSCPYAKNGDARLAAQGQNEDTDGDRVGDACDNCSKKNGYRACNANSDCAGTPAGALCVGSGYGKCAGPNGESCASSADCPFNGTGGHYACNGLGTFGHCDRQVDDADGDGVGNACDLCPNTASVQITSNTNIDNEDRKVAPHLGDMCDPVPQLVTRVNIGRVEFGTNQNLDPLASSTSFTTFSQSHGIGIGASPSSVTEVADLRYCHCLDASGQPRSRAVCITGQCAPTDTPVGQANWRTMTTSTSTNLNVLPPIPTSAGATISASYTQAINCNDTFVHAPVSDTCRLGTQRLLRWDHPVDINRDPPGYPTYSDGIVTHTAGIVLSHVRKTTNPNPARDAFVSLRHTYEYVTTPAVRYVAGTATRSYRNCLVAGCSMVFRPDWVIYPPDFIRTQQSPLDDLSYYGRISPQPDGTYASVGRLSDPVFDLTAGMGPDVLDVVGSPDVAFLTPVESGATATARQDRSRPFAVGMTSPWRAASLRPWGVRTFENGIMYLDYTQLSDPPPSNHPFGAARFAPADRDGARALYSADALAVYLVGGHRVGTGEPTREVWRYDLKSDTWTSELHNVHVEAVMQDPRAVGFDASTETIVAVDEVPGATTRRLLRIDLKSKIVRVVAELPAFANAGRYSLVHAGAGEYFLLRQTQGTNSLQIFRFRLAGSSVLWLGRRTEIADLLDDAFATPVGVLAPITRELQGQHDFIVVGTTSNTNTPTSL